MSDQIDWKARADKAEAKNRAQMNQVEMVLGNLQEMRWKWVSKYMNDLVEDSVKRLEGLLKKAEK